MINTSQLGHAARNGQKHPKRFLRQSNMAPFEAEPLTKDKRFAIIRRFLASFEHKFSKKFGHRKAKESENRLVMLRTIRATISLLAAFMSICVFEYSLSTTDSKPVAFYCIHVFIILIGVIQIGLYLFIIVEREALRRYLNVIPHDLNPFYSWGIGTIVFKIILYLIQPSIFDSVRRWTIAEVWWDPLSLESQTFNRSFNDLLILIHFTFNYWHGWFDVMMLTKWGSSHSRMWTEKFNVERPIHFVYVSLSVDHPFSFSCVCFILIWYYFTLILRVSETGPLIDLLRQSIAVSVNDSARTQLLSIFFSTQMCIWNVFVTMTTIGYGDFTVLATLSRIIMSFSSMFGIVVFSGLVAGYTNYFMFTKNQKITYNFHNALLARKEVQRVAAEIVGNRFRTYVALKNNDYSKYQAFKDQLDGLVKDLKESRRNYQEYTRDSNQLATILLKVDNEADILGHKLCSIGPDVAQIINKKKY
jgi:hypothetical protein